MQRLPKILPAIFPLLLMAATTAADNRHVNLQVAGPGEDAREFQLWFSEAEDGDAAAQYVEGPLSRAMRLPRTTWVLCI
jgi:hypothetical protein